MGSDGADRRARVGPLRRGAIAALLWGAAVCPTGAAAQSAPPPDAGVASPQDQPDNPGDDFARPYRLFQLEYQYQTSPGKGLQPGATSEVTSDTLNLRLDNRIDFGPSWALGLRADLPLLAKNPVSSDNPFGDYLYGLGDADAQASLIYTLDLHWKAGVGLRLIAPTGDTAIGSGKWQLMPGVAVRYAWPELSPGSYIEPLLRYDFSFAGNPAKRNIGNLQFAPTFNIGLPNRWFLTLYPSPDIRVNFSDPVTGQTGRLFLPLDLRIGRKITDDLVLSLEVGAPIVNDYPVYDFKTQLRMNLTF